jgi:hypothetical protein
MKKLLGILVLAALGCADDGRNGLNGADGAAGQDGSQGIAGDNGSGCSVTQTKSGAIITCADGSTAVILNGKDCKKGHEHE